MNDIIDEVQVSRFRLFAADVCKVFTNFNAQSVQVDINGLSDWSRLNIFDFQPTKCKVVDLSGKNYTGHDDWLQSASVC